jgi:single-stranded-DNA-specific exonuclease
VASKITEEFGFPAVLISLEGENGKGSARSVEGFNLFEALKALRGLLVDFGGHEGACGLKIKKEKIEEFRKEFYALARKHFIEREDVLPELNVDFSLPFSSIGVKLINEMELLKPYGPDNLEPVFCTSGLRVKNFPRDIGKSGFKFLVHAGNLACEVISFNKNKVAKPQKGSTIDLAYTPSLNVWDGLETIQLGIKDLQVVE